MTTARTKKKVLVNISKEQAEDAFSDYATAESQREELVAKMEQEITRIRDKYSERLDNLNEKLRDSVEVLQAYASENKELFSTRKSHEMTHGVIGYRTGNFKLGKLTGFKWDDVLEKVKKYLPDYIRTKEELNKEGLIADRDNAEVNKQFGKCGIEVNQDETFYVQAKKEAVTA